MNITIPNWISCHTYFQGTEESRTYISNEKTHTYLQLDGITSDLWKLLCDGANDESLELFATQNGVEEEIYNFIENLADLELLIIGDAMNCQCDDNCAPLCNNENDAKEEQAFVEEMQNWLYKNGFMYSLFFELTYRCNLKCVHCYNPKHMSDVELDFNTIKKAIDDAYDLGCFKVTFSGGESTLHSRFLEIVKYARSKHISVEIFTNGQVLESNVDLYNAIKSLYPYRICVSLYSDNAKIHETVTDVPGSFKKTFDLINKMKRENLNVQIKNFLLNFNCMDCINVKKYAEKIGATSVADISLIPTIEGDKKTMKYAISEKELFSLYINPESPLYIKEDYKPLDLDKIKNGSPCLGGLTGLSVTPNAEVTICVSLPYTVGDLRKDSIKSIWESAIKKDENSKLYKWQSVTVADCTDCYKNEYCSFCNYCPGMGYLENGYLKKSDVQCTQAKTKMKAYYYLRKLKK